MKEHGGHGDLRLDSYIEIQGPTGGLRAGKTLCSRALMTRSSR
jgi:hypothetical protein